MNKDLDYITQEKKDLLEAELKELFGPKRKELLLALEQAKALGDLSENAEYHQAREDQAKLESRIKEIEHILKHSQIIKKTDSKVIQVGSVVILEKDGLKGNITYTIVGSEEANMAEGKISHKSPLGSALFGKKKGDNIKFETPKGLVNYKIIEIS